MAQDTPVVLCFESTIRSCIFVMPKTGKHLNFIDGKYFTEDPEEIEFLKYELRSNPHLRKEVKEASEIDASVNSAVVMRRLEENLRAKILAEMAEAQDPTRDMGNTTETKQQPMATTGIPQAAMAAKTFIPATPSNVGK